MAVGRKLTPEEYYEVFFKMRTSFTNNMDSEYDKFLHKTDQALRNISMYLIENYKGEYESCRFVDSGKHCQEYCKYLNEWLNEKQGIYTSNAKCSYYNKLWKDYVEDLWIEMDKSTIAQYKCQRDTKINAKEFPKEYFSEHCNLSPSDVLSLTCPDKDYANSCTTMLTVTYVAVGIILLYMYFSKFSTLGNKIKNLIKNKIGIGNHMDKEENEELLSTQNDTVSSISRMYNLSYNSPRN
ncbi:PIR Superfamily Protein [Plasmodium ovale wallikeri]|uniref:PIR Superfamily Protein n=1 Tax=Plasmodium ovale wallikeri TaxID=864142 RepID=A0A1A9AHA0_PLAOA|nr:PIR Superfamily Protein [Plasmodium ovale wallikeri]